MSFYGVQDAWMDAMVLNTSFSIADTKQARRETYI